MELAIDLDDEVYRDLRARAERMDFDSVEAYAGTVLELVVDELESGGSGDEAVEERLEDLGYLH